jgi:hypothetical protein
LIEKRAERLIIVRQILRPCVDVRTCDVKRA